MAESPLPPETSDETSEHIAENRSESRMGARQNNRKKEKKKPAPKAKKPKNRQTPEERRQGRLVYVGLGFLILFGGVSFKAILATVLAPVAPLPNQITTALPEIPKPDPKALMSGGFTLPNVKRASITDRNGQPLAISLPMVQVYANPQEIIDPEEVVAKLSAILPDLKRDLVLKRLHQHRQFVYLSRDITPTQELAINNLGIPGLYFENSEKRRYPLGNIASHILGSVDIDDHGIAGVERYFDKRLMSDPTPLRLSIDTRVQAAIREELYNAKEHFSAIGASAILMDVRTGEILAMVSLPDFDANNFSHTPSDARFNRAVTGMYEPGSTFKLQTAAMALQLGVAHIWDRFSTIPIHVGRFKISDLKSDHFAPWLPLTSVMAYSSNPASAHIALDVGAKRQREWLKLMGFLDRVPIELPEVGHPIAPSKRNWGLTTVMTVGFGHGVAESPLAIVRGTAAAANGGYLITPTLVAQPHNEKNAQTPKGLRVISEKNADILRRILRLDVTKGTGRNSESPGYFVGGKTGTAEKVGAHGQYLKHVNITAFTGVFPMNDPHYALYVMLDAPKPTAETHGWTTAGWIAAPTFSKIVTRTAPMLGLFPPPPDQMDKIEQGLTISLNPPVPRGVRPLGPGNDPGAPSTRKHTHSRGH